MTIARIAPAVALFGLLALGVPAAADELRYELPLPAHQQIGYIVDFEAPYAGQLELSVEWEGTRVLSFRLEEVGSDAQPFRLSGPSPQSFSVEVPNPGDIPRPYRLHIRGLASRVGGPGLLVIRRPEAPPEPPPLLEQLPPAAPPPMEWSELPPDTPEPLRRFSIATDRFLDAVQHDPRGDACRWQADLAGFLDRERDAMVAGSRVPSGETRTALDEIVEMVRRVEAMRTSDDPVLAGPPPEEPSELKHWSRVREERIRTVEAELDTLLAAIERGHAPALARQPWPYRFVSCVVGCQRHFEERVRVGKDRAVNRQLVEDQWQRLLEAADLLESYASFSGVRPSPR